MKMSPTIPMLAVLAVAVVIAAALPAACSSSASTRSALVIRHQLRGCHAWTLNGGAFKPTQTVTVHRGSWIRVTNIDVMPHKLVETSGPAVTITRLNTGMGMGLKGNVPPALLAHMGASAKLAFSKIGVYKFTTKPGEDYMPGIRTIGADNVLELTVTVS